MPTVIDKDGYRRHITTYSPLRIAEHLYNGDTVIADDDLPDDEYEYQQRWVNYWVKQSIEDYQREQESIKNWGETGTLSYIEPLHKPPAESVGRYRRPRRTLSMANYRPPQAAPQQRMGMSYIPKPQEGVSKLRSMMGGLRQGLRSVARNTAGKMGRPFSSW